jgi:hypothetical protein
MLDSKCLECGACYYGWALRFSRNRTCSDCGAALEIFEDGQLISKGYSLFAAEKHSVNLTPASKRLNGNENYYHRKAKLHN